MKNTLEGKKIVGAKQTLKAVKGNKAKVVYVANNAEVRVTKPIIDECNTQHVEIVFVDTMHDLGELCSIEVGAAIACVLKTDN